MSAFKGQFLIGGKSPIRDYRIKLYRRETVKQSHQDFLDSIGVNTLAYDSVEDLLLYRDEIGKLWKAKFEEYENDSSG